MKAKTVKEVLVAARWIQDHLGWSQGHAHRNAAGNPAWINNDIRSVCLWGAISLVESEDDNLKYQARWAISQAVDSSNAVAWNDTPGRTKQQVLEAFDKAIEKA